MSEVLATYRRFVPVVITLYILSVAFGFLFFNVHLSVEWVAIVLFGAALLSGRALLFLRDWGVFIAVLLAWQLTSPLATAMGMPWHLTELINADKLMFGGHIPTLWLQAHLYHPGKLEPWDVLAASVYILHFLTPLAAGFLIWMTNRELFRQFALAFVVVAIAGFATYILYPAVPPWMAAEPLRHVHGTYVPSTGGHVYLPGVKNLFHAIAGHWYNPSRGDIGFGFLHMNYDRVAAVPSEHAAYPMLFFLFLRRQFGRWAYLALLYILAVIFGITYLGQHYVIDAVLGFIYAFVGYAVVVKVVPEIRAARAKLRPVTPVLRRPELEEA